MPNEGYLGGYKLSGERCATDDHPLLLHALPLAEDVTSELSPGLLLCRADAGGKVLFRPWISTDAAPAVPVAVVDDVSPAGSASALCVVHGLLKPGCSKVVTPKPSPTFNWLILPCVAFSPFSSNWFFCLLAAHPFFIPS